MASVIGIGLVLGLSAGAVGEESALSDPPLDSIVTQVVEMLNAGVSDTMILQWLESTGRRPVDIGSQGLIALSEAEASEELMTTLLQLVGARSGEEPAPAVQPAPEEATPEEVGASPARVVTQAADGNGVDATLRLSAKRVWVDEEEPDSPREPRWNVYLYLDGDLVAWVRPDANAEPVEARRLIQPGRREIRVALQRYEERRSGWRYESLSVPTLVEFDVEAGDPVEIEVDMKRIWGLWRDRKDGGPMSYFVRQGADVLAEQNGTGGNPDRWQPLCEDVEANFPVHQGVPRAFKSAMNRCIRWADLWNGTGKSTARTEILKALAEHDFEPPVR